MWPRAKLKFVARFGYGDTLPDDESQDGAFGVFGSNGPFDSFSRANTGAPAIIIGRKGSYGKVNWTAKPCFASDTTFFVDESTSRHHLRWVYWLLQTLRLDEGTDEAAVPGLNRETAYSRDVLVPPPTKQRIIADYLDHETARLDALVAAKERVLGLLAEKRRALITRAVTRGLDSNAPFRDSSIPWLGEIPVHWKVVQLKFASNGLQTGPFGSQLHAEDYVTGGTPVVNPSHLDGGRIHAAAGVSVDEATADRLAAHRLSLGDLVFARRGKIGRCGVVEPINAGWLCGTGSLRVRLRKDFAVPYYFALVFAETRISDLLAVQSVGSTMNNLNTEILGRCHVPVPPPEEQRTIVNHIDRETAKLDRLRAATRRTISLLKERREILIAKAVSGQVEVT